MPRPVEDRSDVGGAAQFNNIGPVPLSVTQFNNIGPIPLSVTRPAFCHPVPLSVTRVPDGLCPHRRSILVTSLLPSRWVSVISLFSSPGS